MTTITIIMAMDTTIITETVVRPATRLLTWLSPAFPVGGFSYSHGLEYAIEAGSVRDRAGLTRWLDGILRFGAGRIDGILLLAAYRAALAGDPRHLVDVAELAAAQRGTAELALETGAQGQAFIKAVKTGWPSLAAAPTINALAESKIVISYPIAVGSLAALAGLDAATVLEAYLTAFATNLISAGIRLVPLGQSDGIAAIAALEPLITALVPRVAVMDLGDLGSATLMVDWSSMKHETQYTRLFRS